MTKAGKFQYDPNELVPRTLKAARKEKARRLRELDALIKQGGGAEKKSDDEAES